MATVKDTVRELNEPIKVHYHEGDREPRLTPMALAELVGLHSRAFDLIRRLDKTIVDSEQLMKRLYDQKGEAETRVAQLEAEKAALLEHLRSAAEHGGVCIGCKHADEGVEVMEHCQNIDFDCENCEDKCSCHSCEKASNFEWRGVGGMQ